MANEQNLKPFQTVDEAREKGQKGGVASGKARAEKKLLRDALEKRLKGRLDKITESIINEAEKGNTKAYEIIRDTLGEKPSDKLVENNFAFYTPEPVIKEI